MPALSRGGELKPSGQIHQYILPSRSAAHHADSTLATYPSNLNPHFATFTFEDGEDRGEYERLDDESLSAGGLALP